MFRLILIIPAYEPTDKLIGLIKEVQQNSRYRIVIVNDGSSEYCNSFFDKAENEGCIVLHHQVNQGKGAALKTAFTYVLENYPEEDGVVCADCDGQHSWQDIQQVAQAQCAHQKSIVLGSREFVGSVPFKSFIGNSITRVVFSLVSGYKIRDTQTGLRGFSIDMLPWLLEVKGSRYEYEMNQLLDAKSAGYSIISIPITTIYEKNNEGSHFRPIADSIRIYLPIIKFGLSSLSCGIIDFIFLFFLQSLTGNLLFAVVGARVVSSLTNYLLNRNFVFQAKKQAHSKSILKYYSLVVLILACNYLMLSFLTNNINLSLVIAKVLTETVLFLVSFYVQKRFVFFAKRIRKMTRSAGPK